MVVPLLTNYSARVRSLREKSHTENLPYWQGRGLRSSREDRTSEVNKLYGSWLLTVSLFARFLQTRNRPVCVTMLRNRSTRATDQNARYIGYKHRPYNLGALVSRLGFCLPSREPRDLVHVRHQCQLNDQNRSIISRSKMYCPRTLSRLKNVFALKIHKK